MSDTPSTPKITPGSLVIFKRSGQQRTLGRVLRLFDKNIHRWGGVWINTSDVKPHAEVLALVVLDTFTPCRSSDNGCYTYDVLLSDLTPFDEATRKEVFDDLATRLNRVRQAIRLYETTVECDPKFSVPKFKLEDSLKGEEKGDSLNVAEILTKLYGECYPNPHLKCKVQ